MREKTVTTEEYRGYEIQVREKWHPVGHKLSGRGICHTGGDINFETQSTRVPVFSFGSVYSETVEDIRDGARHVVDTIREGDTDAVFDMMSAGDIIQVWSDKRVEMSGETHEEL